MPLPPAWLVAWTEYILLTAVTISAILALWRGQVLLKLKIRALPRP